MNLRAWLDSTPLASIALTLMREATGRERPLEPIAPTRPAALRSRTRVGFWSLAAGVGSSTIAALVAHRSAAGGNPPILVDLDRWAPSLALRAKIDAATVADALLMPGREREVVSRWSAVPFLPGAPGLHRLIGTQAAGLLSRIAVESAAVVDLGAGPDALDPALLASLDELVVVAGARVAQLQAAFCSVDLLAGVPCRIGLALVAVEEEDARAIAARLPWPLRGAIPADSYLAGDSFAARAPTLRAIDGLIRSLG